MADPLAVATLIIYLVLIHPTLFCLWTHGRRGFLGWWFLQALCLIRIAGNAVQLHGDATHDTNSHALLINSIGLSPLMLAIAGILHEARRARDPQIRPKVEWFLVIQYHLLVSAALAFIIVGVVHLESGTKTSTTSTVLKIGLAVLLVSWVVLMFWAAFSLLFSRGDRNASAYRAGTMLLYGVLVALPLVVFRLVYAAISLMLELNHPHSSFLTSTVAKVLLSTVPEMIVTIILLAAGISTRRMYKGLGRWRRVEPDSIDLMERK